MKPEHTQTSTSPSSSPPRGQTATDLAAWCISLAEAAKMDLADWQRMIEAEIRIASAQLVPPRSAPPAAAPLVARGDFDVHFELWNRHGQCDAEFDTKVFTAPERGDVIAFRGHDYAVEDRYLELEQDGRNPPALRILRVMAKRTA